MGNVTTGIGFLVNSNSTVLSLRNMGDTVDSGGSFIDDIYTANMKAHSSGEGNFISGEFFYQV